MFGLREKIRRGKISLRRVILLSILAASLLSFGGGHLIASLFISGVLRDNSLEQARLLFPSLKEDILSQMMQGKQDSNYLESILTENMGKALNLDIDVFSRKDMQTGSELWERLEADTRETLLSGERVIQEKYGQLTHFYPLKADKDCLGCHQNSKPGEILGFIEMQQDLLAMVHGNWLDLFMMLFLLSPLPLSMALIVASSTNRRLKTATDQLHDKIVAAHNVEELTNLDLKGINLGYVELNKILLQFRKLIHKVKHVAVDKEILAFEIKLLEKFIITSDVVKDWKQYVGRLLLEINSIMHAHTLFSVFKVDDELYDLDIFWRGVPTLAMKEKITATIHSELSGKDCPIDLVGVNVNHNIVDTNSRISEADFEEITIQTKSLVMDAPRIGGVIGIGVQALKANDPVMSLVVDGILTSLLNVVGSIRAIYKYTRELEYYATRDPLTDIFNQRMFWEMLGYEVGRAARHDYNFSILFIDFDNFKRVNDSFGHKFGDKYLCEATQHMRNALRDGDILCRYGGDEFVIILPEIAEEQGYAAAERVRDEIEKMVLETPDGALVKATISIGLASFPEHGKDSKNLFMVADDMMYKAKKAGKNAIGRPCAEDLEDLYRQDKEKNNLIYRALENDELIKPFFQPIQNMQQGQIEIHELLMRLVDGELIVPAAEFVERAEDLGVMHRLDLILIRKAFARVQEENYQGTLFINISPKSLISGQFIKVIRNLTKTYGIEPYNIVFEITERETVKNLHALEKFVQELKNEGFRFAVDDFGSGYSSFQYIKSFSIDFLKINGEFVACLPSDKTFQAFVKSMVTLAQELGIKTIAEYVENQEILQLVNSFEVDFAQGYHIGRPDSNFHNEMSAPTTGS